jgi:hypothetical protein
VQVFGTNHFDGTEFVDILLKGKTFSVVSSI